MNYLSIAIRIIAQITSVLPFAIKTAENLGRIFRPGEKTGPEKRAAVIDAVRSSAMSAMRGIELGTGKEIVDEKLQDEAIGDISDGVVKFLKAWKVL